MRAKQIVDLVRQGGVVGAGGAGFPTHVKLNCSVETVVINAAECEPLLRVDQELLKKETDSILKGIELVLRAVGAKKAIIGIKAKHKEVINILNKAIESNKGISIFELDDFYPAGDEQILVYETTGKIVPEGGIPLMAGVVVINVETLLNVYNSVNGVPVIYKYVTVTGQVEKPVTVKVPVGTKVIDLIDLAGGTSLDDYMIIDGGPMMGKVINTTARVTKTTKGILILPIDHKIIRNKTLNIASAVKRSMSACCQCRTCSDMCPRHLLGHNLQPHMIMRAASYGISADSATITSAVLCSECGICDVFACPMGLPPRQINIEIKKRLAQGGYKSTHKVQPDKVMDYRDYRKVPVKRLIERLNIKKWDLPAHLVDIPFEPTEVEISLKQHIGKPCLPIVNKNDLVEAGQLIGSIPDGAMGANIHASIKGIVKSVDNNKIVISRV